MTKIMLVDRQDEYLDIELDIIRYIGAEIFTTDKGKEALSQEDEFDVYLIGTDLADISGFRVCREIRSRLNRPIIMLTDNHDDSMKFIAYESGADRFIEKPFNETSFELSVRAMLRIEHPESNRDIIKMAGIEMDLNNRTITSDSRAVELTQTEYRILEHMMRNQGRAISRLELIKHIWGFERGIPTSTLNVHMKNIRDKLGINQIETIRGYGYRLNGQRTKDN